MLLLEMVIELPAEVHMLSCSCEHWKLFAVLILLMKAVGSIQKAAMKWQTASPCAVVLRC